MIPHTFGNLSGIVSAAYLDENFEYILDLIGQGGGATPSITYAPPTLAAPAAPGTAAGIATITGLAGGTWSLNPTTYFQINAVTGAVAAASTVSNGTYPFTISYSGTANGQTITVSLNTSIVVSGTSGSSSDFFFPSGSNLADVAAAF